MDVKTQMSASDLVYCISAILENPKGLCNYSLTEQINPQTSSVQSSKVCIISFLRIIWIMNKPDENSILAQYEEQRVLNFWAAYEALSG